ncbi:hypothetical protein, partial [uncultured Ferrimonas sp.]|uniref:hypothetical protein n=1 Tax=uncultured Ferrimonas sp. TaxID=432640 RepID=UPI002603F741
VQRSQIGGTVLSSVGNIVPYLSIKMFPDISRDPDFNLIDVFLSNDAFKHDSKFLALPGENTDRCDNFYELIGDRLINSYIAHCLEQCRFMLTWEGENFSKVMNITSVVNENQNDNEELGQLFNGAIQSLSMLDVNLEATPSSLDSTSLINKEATNVANKWLALAIFCGTNNLLEKFSGIMSTKSIFEEHYLAAVATDLLNKAKDTALHDYIRGRLAVIAYKMINIAETISNERHNQLKSTARKGKKRQVQSIDQFYINKLVGPKTAKAYWGLVRDLFLKQFVYSYWKDNPDAQQKVVAYKLQERFYTLESEKPLWLKDRDLPEHYIIKQLREEYGEPEPKSESDSDPKSEPKTPDTTKRREPKSLGTLNELVGKMKKPGYLTQKWEKHEHLPEVQVAIAYAEQQKQKQAAIAKSISALADDFLAEHMDEIDKILGK